MTVYSACVRYGSIRVQAGVETSSSRVQLEFGVVLMRAKTTAFFMRISTQRDATYKSLMASRYRSLQPAQVFLFFTFSSNEHRFEWEIHHAHDAHPFCIMLALWTAGEKERQWRGPASSDKVMPYSCRSWQKPLRSKRVRYVLTANLGQVQYRFDVGFVC